MKGIAFFAFFVLVCIMAPASFAQCTGGSCEYARQMQATGVFRHDASYRGAEVIYWSSGTATAAQARRSWMRSPAHRRLLLTGRIKNVSCYGNYCVGR